MKLADLQAPIVDPAEGDPLSDWRWLVDGEPVPVLVTALGDVFVRTSQGEIWFVDTYRGVYEKASPGETTWQAALRDPSRVEAWFLPDLVASLRERGLHPASGQCYSPRHPPVVGGSMAPDNFECSAWLIHMSVTGQIHEQVKDLPDGTPIRGFE